MRERTHKKRHKTRRHKSQRHKSQRHKSQRHKSRRHKSQRHYKRHHYSLHKRKSPELGSISGSSSTKLFSIPTREEEQNIKVLNYQEKIENFVPGLRNILTK